MSRVFVEIILTDFNHVVEMYKHKNHISDLRLNVSKTFSTDIIKTLLDMNIIMKGFFRVLDMHCLTSVHIYFISRFKDDTC